MTKNKKTKNWLAISTSTLLGGLVMTIVSSVLGTDAPWIIEKLISKTDRVTVSFNVNDIEIKKGAVPDTKEAYFEPNLNFLLIRPSSINWTIQQSMPGSLLNSISVTDVPYFKFSAESLVALSLDKPKTNDELVTTYFSLRPDSLRLEYSDSSKIEGFKISFNPADDLDFVKSAVETQERQVDKMISAMLGEDEADDAEEDEDTTADYTDEDWKDEQEDLKEVLDSVIKRHSVKSRTLIEGVTVTTFKRALFERNPLYNLRVCKINCVSNNC
ncbi:hypothetical protein [Chryseolinea lacunae]|uniref:DUF4230 domain-containing protein n=1 Tax=Chryseolinea lacunae TaxID=2801331 RepID=A0ABS1L0I6_9BACT|nr:hypothetical protein [Chryseolinea lacunae]MBL0745214.1 hypothetical protein [Chryseolinea lacunae]